MANIIESSRPASSHITLLELPAICIGTVLSASAAVAPSMWIAALLQRRVLTTGEVGWLASGESLLCALSCIAASVWGAHFRVRAAAVPAALVVMAANLIAAWSFNNLGAAFAIGRLAGGAALGRRGLQRHHHIGAASQRRKDLRSLTRRGDDYRRLFQLTRAGADEFSGYVFLLFAGIAGVAAMAMLAGLPDGRFESNRDVSRTQELRPRGAAPLMACFFIFVIGKGLQIDFRDMGHATLRGCRWTV